MTNQILCLCKKVIVRTATMNTTSWRKGNSLTRWTPHMPSIKCRLSLPCSLTGLFSDIKWKWTTLMGRSLKYHTLCWKISKDSSARSYQCLTTTNRASFITASRTVAEKTTYTVLNFANTLRLTAAHRTTTADALTTESNVFIIKTSTRPNSVICIPAKSLAASTEITAALLTLLRTFKCVLSISCSHKNGRINITPKKTSPSTFTTLSQSGVLTTTSTIKRSASMRTTTKTSEDVLTFSNTRQNSVNAGSQVHSSHATRKAAIVWKSAKIHTVGKNNSSIPWFTKLNLVWKGLHALKA